MSLSSSRLVSLFALCSVTAFAGSALAVSADAPPAKGKTEPASVKIQARSAKQGKVDRPTLPAGRDSRIVEELMAAKDTPWLVARPASNGGGGDGGGDGGVAGQCTPVVSTHTNASFEGGQYIVQAGFAEQEIAAASYTLTAADFPLRVDLCEMIFATSNATVTTTTKWSVIVWEGTPATGSIKYIFSSNGVDLPHLVMQPGTNGTNIQFGIDPNDPDQIVIQNDGSNTFSVGYRIDDHNLQTQDPCLVAPPSSANAFPTTDVGGLQNPTKNWLFLLNCGAFGCPAGWKNFSQLPTLCRPTGDWVMRVTWTPYSCQTPGACCLPNGSCQVLNESTCLAQAGSFIGPGTTCTASTCSAALAPCCFASTGGCLTPDPGELRGRWRRVGPGGPDLQRLCLLPDRCVLPAERQLRVGREPCAVHLAGRRVPRKRHHLHRGPLPRADGCRVLRERILPRADPGAGGRGGRIVAGTWHDLRRRQQQRTGGCLRDSAPRGPQQRRRRERPGPRDPARSVGHQQRRSRHQRRRHGECAGPRAASERVELSASRRDNQGDFPQRVGLPARCGR